VDQDVKKQWVEALRRGKYEQGHEQLRRDGRFCCLGILCEIIDPEGWEESKSIPGYFRHRGEAGKPLPGVYEKVELTQGQVDSL
jgi:hypothetical protein